MPANDYLWSSMKYSVLFVLWLGIGLNALSQSVTGNFVQLANNTLRLEGFSGFNTYAISSTTVDQHGNFCLSYTASDCGVGYLVAADEIPFIVILTGEAIILHGDAPSNAESISVINGQENKWFEQYATEHPRRAQALNAWTYLEQIYSLDSLFTDQHITVNSIASEKQRIQKEDDDFLAMLPNASYVQWFLPIRKLVSSVATIAQYRPEEVASTIDEFQLLDYSDERLYKSGLLRDALESHFWLLENSGQPIDSAVATMKHSIDLLVEQLMGNDDLLNEITNYLFDLLERHSLFEASEHLALRLLNENGCVLETELARQFETYRAMRKGNTAADIEFTGELLQLGVVSANMPKRLTELTSAYTLVVFAASWCETCRDEMPQLIKHYKKWRENGLEVVLISLDDNSTDFKNFAKNAPFLSACDYQRWDGAAVNDYFIFGTPSFFLLDAKRQIQLRPNSVAHADSWVEWHLVRKK